MCREVSVEWLLVGSTSAVSYAEFGCWGPRDISQINFFLSLVNAKRVLFSPLVIVGFQIFERPSGGRYGGRWISDRYLKSNIYQIFGVQKSVWHKTGSNPRPRITSGKAYRRQIPFDHRSFTWFLYNFNIPPPFGDLTNLVSTTPSFTLFCFQGLETEA